MSIHDLLKYVAWSWSGWFGCLGGRATDGARSWGKPMLITVTRTYKDDDGLYGLLAIDSDPFKCATLERLSLCIPTGTYDVLFMWSEHFQQIMPHIIVPGRTAIEVHWANYPAQLEGCLALGKDDDKTDDMVTESKVSWIGFVKAITDQPSIKIKYVEDFGKAVL